MGNQLRHRKNGLFAGPGGCLDFNIRDHPDTYKVFWKIGGATSERAVIRFALRDVLDDQPMGEGPDFPCRVAWKWFSWWQKDRTIDNEDFFSMVSCRTPKGMEPLPLPAKGKISDNVRFRDFPEIVIYLATGKIPDFPRWY